MQNRQGPLQYLCNIYFFFYAKIEQDLAVEIQGSEPIEGGSSGGGE